MDIICASICYRGNVDDEVAGTLANAPALGYRFMEIHGPMTWTIDAVDAFDLPSVTAKIAASGLRCAGIYPPGWGGTDAADVAAHARAVTACVGFAEALGADHVATTGTEKRGAPGAISRVIDCVRQVLRDTDPVSPVRLCLEPHFGNALQEPDDFAEILEAIPDPRVGLCVDTGHFHSAGADTPALIHRFAPRIFNVHFKDHIGAVSVGIGRGEIDLPAVIAALRAVDYTGDLTVELEVDDPENLPRYTQEAYVYIRGLLGQKL